MKNRKTIIRVIIGTAAAVTASWLLWGNLTVGTTHYSCTSERLPAALDGLRVAHISDLHNAVFGKNNSVLTGILKEEKPDIIVFTGDIVDATRTDIEKAVNFAEQAAQIAPCFYVTGNHESRIGNDYAELEHMLKEAGVTVLRNASVRYEKNGESILIAGIDDPEIITGSWNEALTELCGSGEFTVLLSHRPERFGQYVENGADVVFCGHAHGGQIRIPFIGGVLAPSQGFFPEYDCGVYTANGTSMVVSRGIGNSVAPVRVNDRPEVVIADIHCS